MMIYLLMLVLIVLIFAKTTKYQINIRNKPLVISETFLALTFSYSSKTMLIHMNFESYELIDCSILTYES